jgi:DNA-binding XRE family transcriptional regulator
MKKRQLNISRKEFGLTLQAVADRFERPVTRQAIRAIEQAADGVKFTTARRYEEAVRLALLWRNEMRNMRKRFRPIVNGALEKAARRVGLLRS